MNESIKVLVDENRSFTYKELLDMINHVRNDNKVSLKKKLRYLEWILLTNSMIHTKEDDPKIIISDEGEE